MAVTLNFTTIRDCDSTTGLSTSGALGNLGPADFTPQQGTGAVEFNATGTGGLGDLTATLAAGSFNSETNDVSCWFLNPGFTNAGDPVLETGQNAVQIWLSNGTVTAYYNQGGQNDVPGGWSLLRCNGAATPDDTAGGTWNSAAAQAVTSVGIRIRAANDNDGKSDTAFGADWFKYHDRIDVTGNDGGSPWTFDRIAEISEAIGQGGGRWGLFLKTDVFYRCLAGLRWDNDGATRGSFADENKNVFFDALATTLPYDVEVNTADVRLGLKDSDGASGVDYAVNGCNLRSVLGNPDLTVANDGELLFYGGRIQGFGTINLGSGGTVETVEILNTDIFENTEILFNSTQLIADNLRLHQTPAAGADIGRVLQVPNSMSNIRVFQCGDGVQFEVTMTATGYIAGDNTFDVVIQEGDTVTLVDSVFADNKLARVP